MPQNSTRATLFVHLLEIHREVFTHAWEILRESQSESPVPTEPGTNSSRKTNGP